MANLDNDIQPQNRLRLIDYLKIYKEIGMKVVKLETQEGNLEVLKQIKLADSFKNYTLDELVITHGYIFSKA